MPDRNRVYIQVLAAGLVAIRHAAEAGDVEWCRAEAEHIHNIPSLIDEANETRHLDYLAYARTEYIDWVKRTRKVDVYRHVKANYIGAWEKLDLCAGTGHSAKPVVLE